MKTFIKNNLKTILAFIIGIVISGGVVYASSILASTINYDNSRSGLKDNNDNDVEDVQTAIDVLYDKAINTSGVTKKVCKYISEGSFGQEEQIGAKYECDPGDGVKRNFYILEANNNKVDLIMENNISDTVGTLRTTTWKDAMKFFRTGAGASIKESWTNVIDIDLPKAQAIVDATERTNWLVGENTATWWCFGSKAQDSQSSPYCNSTTNAPYAWLFNHLTDCTLTGCTTDSGATAYGYWTRDLIYNTTNAWCVHGRGTLTRNTVTDDTYYGIRPVITVLKSNLY